MEDRPKVGIGVIIIKDDKVLLGKRKGSHGEGSWCFPGGHLEFGETLEECARRETLEESGIKIKNIGFATITEDIFKEENRHYITVFMISDYDSGEPRVMEPDKFENWEWFEWDNMPQPLFLPNQNLLKKRFNPFEMK